MDTLEILIAARAEVEKGWCRFVPSNARHEVCAIGAIWAAQGWSKWGLADRRHVQVARDLRPLLEAHTDGVPIQVWNDTHSQADVLALFDRAIVAEAVKVTADTAHTFATVS